MAQSRWLAFELHDGLMQWVIGARMHMAALVSSLKQHPGDAPAVEELETRLTQILSYLTQAAEEGRHLIRFVEGLPNGEVVNVVEMLAATVDLLSRKTRDGRPEVIFKRPEQPWPDLPPHFAWTIVRIVQQAAMNAVRHSNATNTCLTLSSSLDGELCVVIEDDGQGFDPTIEYPGHFGLKSMRQRAREANLILTLASKPCGGGTRVTLRIPVEAVEKSQNYKMAL